jgi:2-phosphosulfolactate phosphatase
LYATGGGGEAVVYEIAGAKTVLAAAMTNRASIVDYLLRLKPETVWIVGSGWEGSYALEDTVCAGAIIQSLQDKVGQVYGNDEAVAAVSLFDRWQHDLVGLFELASHGQRLLKLNCMDDIKYCATLDSVPVIPIRGAGGVFTALAT